MVDKRLVWSRIKSRAETEIKDYEDAIYISQNMLRLAEKELAKISGAVIFD